MTISIPTTQPVKNLVAYHDTWNGEPGYTVSIGTERAFVHEKDADKLARYMLFAGEPEDTPSDEG